MTNLYKTIIEHPRLRLNELSPGPYGDAFVLIETLRQTDSATKITEPNPVRQFLTKMESLGFKSDGIIYGRFARLLSDLDQWYVANPVAV